VDSDEGRYSEEGEGQGIMRGEGREVEGKGQRKGNGHRKWKRKSNERECRK
jgi:hypothetical protein